MDPLGSITISELRSQEATLSRGIPFSYHHADYWLTG